MLLTIKPQAALLILIEPPLPPRAVTLRAATPGREPETRRLSPLTGPPKPQGEKNEAMSFAARSFLRSIYFRYFHTA
jgi:hypothetical protein